MPCPRLGLRQSLGRGAGAAGLGAALRPRSRAIRGEAEIELLEAADLVAQPRRLLEFEIGGGGAHLLLEIGDDGLEVGALIMRRVALAETDGNVVLLVAAFENVGAGA